MQMQIKTLNYKIISVIFSYSINFNFSRGNFRRKKVFKKIEYENILNSFFYVQVHVFNVCV